MNDEMEDQQPSTADELENGLNTGAELAGRAVQNGLPSRPSRSAHPQGQGHNNSPSPEVNPPEQPGGFSDGSSPSDGGGANGRGEPPSESPQNSSQTHEPSGSLNTAPPSYGGTGDDSGGSGGDMNTSLYSDRKSPSSKPFGGSSSPDSAASATEAAADVGGGTAGGVEAGAAAAEGGAAAGGAAAGSAVSGAASGAAAGSAAGPLGAIGGAVAGALIKPALKLIGIIIVMLTVYLSFFTMHPSFLYDNSKALVDRELLEDTYNTYYENIEGEYQKDIERAMGAAASEAKDIFKKAERQGASGIFSAPDAYPHISMKPEDQSAIRSVMRDSYYDDYEFYYDVAYLRGSEEYLKSASSNINLVMSLLDTQKKNWLSSLFDTVANNITGGFYSQFTDWVGKKWDGIWTEFIRHDLYSISYGGVSTRVETYYTADGEEYEYYIAEIEILYTYDLKDQGISFYANKVNADQEQIDRAAEMANYLADLFGSASDTYLGIFVQGGYYTDAVQGGTVGSNITAKLAELKDQLEGMEYDPDSPHVFPMQGYTNPNMSSHYGPRDFPSNPWHTGIDFGAPPGTPILAANGGVVLFTAQMPNGFGNYVVVYHGEKDGEAVCTMYAHMSRFGSYNSGDPVNAGDVIGYVGSSGLSTGPHLHFQLHVGNTVRNPVEFFEFLDYLRP